MNHPTENQIEDFARRVISGLSDDLPSRRTDLAVFDFLLAKAVPPNSPLKVQQDLAFLIETLRRHELAQAEFSFKPKEVA